MDAFAHWLEQTHLAATVRDSLWITATLSGIHLLGITLFGSGALISGLRAAGLLFRSDDIEAIVHAGRTAIRTGLAIAITTGALLFLPRAPTAIHNVFFRGKMMALLAVLTAHAALSPRRNESNRPLLVIGAIAAIAVILLGSAFILIE